MSDSSLEKTTQLEPELRGMKIEEGARQLKLEGEEPDKTQVKVEDNPGRTPTPLLIPPRSKARSKSQSPVKQPASESSSPDAGAQEEVLGGEITLKMEPGKAPKLSRTASQKVPSRRPQLFFELPDVTAEAKESFVVLPECTYGNRFLGTTEHALECDCSEEWGKSRNAVFGA